MCNSSGLPNIHGALTFTHVCVDSSRTVQEHHRSLISSILVSQLEEKKSQGGRQRLNPDSMTLIGVHEMHDRVHPNYNVM